MTKDKLKGYVTLASLITAIGFILLFFSINFGMSFAEKWIAKQGEADQPTYLIVIEGYTNNFLATGSILFGIGLATILFTYYKILKINE